MGPRVRAAYRFRVRTNLLPPPSPALTPGALDLSSSLVRDAVLAPGLRQQTFRTW